MPTEHFEFRQMRPDLKLQKERLTKDVRYQEFNEVTPDRCKYMVRGHFCFGIDFG